MPDDDRQNGRRPGGNGGKPPLRVRGPFSWVLIFGLALMLLVMLSHNMNRPRSLSISQFWTAITNDNVKKIIIRESVIVGELRRPDANDGRKQFEVSYLRADDKIEDIRLGIAKIEAERGRSGAADAPVEIFSETSNTVMLFLISTMLPWLLIIGVIWFFILRQLRQTGGGAGMLGNFGRSRHRMMTKEHTNITFADVAGVDEAKDEVVEIIEFLKNPKRFQKLGGRIPRGVLLVGEPGCGKTLLAKAIAGEADVPFFSISGSDFVEMFVGVGASRVRDLFRQAKESSPCIVFLDEIDAVGRRRGLGYNGGGHDEREQTLNAILVEMDGFDSSDQVIVIAATNRADVLDPALVRPGRFDRQVFVPLPDVKGRFEILRVHARKVTVQPPIDNKLQRLARGTPMFSGADLAAIINEAALLATMAGKDAVELEDLEEARDKVRFGRAKRSRIVDERDRELTAYHEAGHALVQSLLPAADPVHKVSIIPRGPYGGVTFSLPEKDRMTFNRSYLEATLRVLCAGRIAEELLGQDMNSGAASDIKQATNLVREMITEWGMSDLLGFVYYGDQALAQRGWADMSGGNDFSDRTSELIDAEIKRIVDIAYQDTQRIIAENRERLETIAQALLKYETLDGEEVRALIRGEKLDKPTLNDLIALEQDRRRADPPVARPITQPPPDEMGPLPSPA